MSRGMDRQDDRSDVHRSVGGAKTSAAAGPSSRAQGTVRTPSRATARRQTPRPPDRPLPSGTRREWVLHNGQRYALRGSQTRVLDTLATFRVVLERDLVADVYTGQPLRMGKELASLAAQGLIARRELDSDRNGHHVRAVTLTPVGQDLVQHHLRPSRFSADAARPVHAGWGKPRELVHDASLYRMYLTEEPRILDEGGTIRRVVLDSELKQRLYRELTNRDDASAEGRHARLADLAQAEGLVIVDGHVQLPDVRIEYDTAAGERSKVDLELTTGHYHAGHLAAKQRAGFKLYGAQGRAGIASLGGGRGAAFDPHFLSGLLSL